MDKKKKKKKAPSIHKIYFFSPAILWNQWYLTAQVVCFLDYRPTAEELEQKILIFILSAVWNE